MTDGRTDGQTEFSSQYRVCITCSAVKMLSEAYASTAAMDCLTAATASELGVEVNLQRLTRPRCDDTRYKRLPRVKAAIFSSRALQRDCSCGLRFLRPNIADEVFSFFQRHKYNSILLLFCFRFRQKTTDLESRLVFSGPRPLSARLRTS